MKNVTLLDAEALYQTLLGQIRQQPDCTHLQLIGVHTGGVWLAERLHADLGLTTPLGTIDSAFYRDDLKARGLRQNVQPSQIPFSVEGAHILLVDDVLYTGRTVRGVLNEIFDYGRPAAVQLAVLVDRGGRQLPVAASFAGAHLALTAQQTLVLARSTAGKFTLTLEDAA